MNKDPILRVCTKIIVGPIILFGLYVQFHGDYGPGGGFQAGVIVAAGFILHSLIFGLSEGRKLISQKVIKKRMALTVKPNVKIIFVKEKNETQELEIAITSASDTSLLMV